MDLSCCKGWMNIELNIFIHIQIKYAFNYIPEKIFDRLTLSYRQFRFYGFILSNILTICYDEA